MSSITSAPVLSGQGAAWWFRVTLDTIEQFELLRNPSPSVFNEVTCQLEKNGTHLHVQGLVRLASRARQTSVLKLITDFGFAKEVVRVGRLATLKDVCAMRAYCQKEETRVNEVAPVNFGTKPGSDVKIPPHIKVLNLIREYGESEALKIFITLGLKAKVWRDAKESFALEQQVEVQGKIESEFEKTELRVWQKDLQEVLDDTPDPRSIIVVVDKKGNTGKTYFARYMKAKYPDSVVLLNNGKAGDLAFVMNEAKGSNTILMTLQRSVESIVNYQALEQFKDNVYVSPKYASSSNVGCPNHLVIFSNFPLDWAKLSEDRWVIWKLDKEGSYKTYSSTSYRMAFPDDVPFEAPNAPKTRQQDVDENEPSAKRVCTTDARFTVVHNKSKDCPLECYCKSCQWRTSCPEKGRGINCRPFSFFQCTCQSK